jgi:hypothetical protein
LSGPRTLELERLASELEDAERAHRRAASLQARARAYEAEHATLEIERTAKEREVKRARRGLLGAWLWARGERAERVQALARALERVEQRQASKRGVLADAKAELAAAEQATKAHSLATLRERFQAQALALRQTLSPERASALRTLELELGGARLACDAAEIALRQVHEVAQLLESARVHLETSLRRGFVEALVFDHLAVTHSKYWHIDRATRQLAAAGQLMRDMRVIDSVRDNLERLAPEIGKLLRIADFALDSFLVDLSTMTRTENSLDGVHEAQRLFAELEPRIAQEARVARTHADNLERRFREALVAACAGG